MKILLAQVREFLGQPNYDDDDEVRAYWVDTAQMVADVLTKAGCEREPLLDVLSPRLLAVAAFKGGFAQEATNPRRTS